MGVVFCLKLFYHIGMNSILLSDGKFFRTPSLVLMCALFFLALGCSHLGNTGSYPSSGAQNPARLADELNEEVSLKADRDQLRELRKDVPEEKQTSNDELAMDLELMAKAERPAHEIRGQFQGKVRKLRERFRDKSRDIRERFRKIQKEQRDEFLTHLKREREEFKETKVDREATKEFFAKQDRERKDFFAEQKDQRKEFESEMRQKSKDFQSNMRERVNQFNEQMRIYNTRQREKERAEKKQKQKERRQLQQSAGQGGPIFKTNQKLDTETKKILQEFESMKSVPSTPLGKDSH